MELCAKVGLSALLVAWACSAPAQPLVSSNTTAVLLVGLPGDLPSERTYRAQTESWLEWVAALPQPPRRVYLLWDSEPFPTGPARLDVQMLPARREQFLNLADDPATRTNDLLLVAWGHGGFQRSTPVLHVRGPRLTPEDFKRFTDRTPSTLCILMFRGSGQLAKVIAREGLAVLSSEHDVAFQSDPIGMDLLLQSLGPRTDLKDLGRSLGKATADWYDSRQLARTEEPTLWLGTADPLRLVQAAPATDPVAAAPPSVAANAKPPTPTSPDTNPEETVSERWMDLPTAAREDYPGWDAVILKQHVGYTIAAQPAITAEHEIFLQILTPAGLHYADFNFEYSPPGEELVVVDSEVRRADGQILRLEPADIHESIADSELGYPGRRHKFFSLPGVEPGAILHVRYRSTWKEFPLPHVSLPVTISLELPVKELSLRVEVPRNTPLHFRFQELSAPEPTVVTGEYGRRYSWLLSELYPPALEPFIQPNREPSLLLSTWPDWATFATWYDRISRLADTVTPEIETTARQLTAGLDSEEEKVRVLSQFVTRLRYVAVPLGVNSFRPHAAANVLKNQFGDCKDKANLFNALLHSLKIDAQLVLVPRFAQAYSSLPGFAFNHALSKVTLPNRILWIDTTDDLCRFGLLPPGDAGRSVLVVDGKTIELTSLPDPKRGDHALQLRAHIDLSPTGPCPTTWNASARGYSDYALRTAARHRTDRHSVPLLNGTMDPHAGVFVSTNQTRTSFSDLTTNFHWQAAGQTVGLMARLSHTNQFLVRPPIWLPQGWDQTLQPRTTSLFLNQGYPLRLQEEIVFQLAPHPPPSAGSRAPGSETRVLKLPQPRTQPDAPLSWKLSWENSAPDQLVVSFELDLTEGELDSAATRRFQSQLQALYEALSEAPVLQH